MKISICYYYRRKKKSGDGLPERICRHHIISYPRMFYLGVLALCYLKKLKVSNAGGVDKMWAQLDCAIGKSGINISEVLDEIIYDGKGKFHLGECVTKKGNGDIVKEQNVELYKALNEIAWLPMNTFSGPKENLRLDDPSQKNDGFPCGMPEAQKQALNSIIRALNHYSHSFIPHEEGDGGMTQSVHFDDELPFNRLAEEFFKSINGNWRRYESKISDWRVAANYCREGSNYRYHNKQNFYRFYFYMGKQREERLNTETCCGRIIAGDFVLMNDKIRECTDNKILKILSVKRETRANERTRIQGILVNRDASWESFQNRLIKDFF